jgi:hypothetical protein
MPHNKRNRSGKRLHTYGNAGIIKFRHIQNSGSGRRLASAGRSPHAKKLNPLRLIGFEALFLSSFPTL